VSDDKRPAAATPVEGKGRDPEITRGVVRWLIRESMGVLLVALTLFLPAGTANWAFGWALVGLYAAWVAANALILIPRCPELLVERATRRADAKAWDTAILGVLGLTTIVKHVLAGFDFRFGWTGQIPLALQLAALSIAALGYALMTWAMSSNAFFSMVNRIQDERGHAVAAGGPYRFVRHPAYVGTIAFELATPILLGSLWALLPGGLAALLTVVRTALEDRMLRQELSGYAEYARQTRYRLLPGIW
jgi:protein-S-isoprenylcysteine O-methyltransferase Ste14